MKSHLLAPQTRTPRLYDRIELSADACLDLLPFRPGVVNDVVWKPLHQHMDQRGWLCELFRQDEMPPELFPAMAYLSETRPGLTRGPHEHLQQTDYFCFFGSTFHLYLWDARSDSASYLYHEIAVLDGRRPMSVVVPPGIVHAYRNVGTTPGLVINCPNRLYRGEGKSDPIDEIRHEDDPRTPYQLLDRAPCS